METIQNFMSPRMRRVERIHFIGIGGAGMCGIAEVLHNEGYRVTGSDAYENRVTVRLRSLGIEVNIGHAVDNVIGSDVVVRSTAVHDDNPEVVAARQHRIPVIPRALMLAELMRFRQGIAIAGTHGKTTTTSLVSSLLAEGGLDPSFVIGGKLNSCGSNAQLGTSEYFVAEADESDASFLFLKPTMAVVTNIDADHMTTYGGDFNKLCDTFIEFLHHLPFYGLAVVCVDDPVIQRLIPAIQRPTRTYGFSEEANYRAIDWKQTGMLSEFTVLRPEPRSAINVQMRWPGRHNVLNALAAIAIATELDVDDASIKSGLLKFEGVGRRFQILGEQQFTLGLATVVDDYGHHPREIQATLEAARAVWPSKRLVHVFQPHRYTRTSELFSDFVNVLSMADEVLLFDIYSAGETPIPGISSETLMNAIKSVKPNVTLVTEANYVTQLDRLIADGDVILMQGAGNIGQLCANLMQKERDVV